MTSTSLSVLTAKANKATKELILKEQTIANLLQHRAREHPQTGSLSWRATYTDDFMGFAAGPWTTVEIHDSGLVCI